MTAGVLERSRPRDMPLTVALSVAVVACFAVSMAVGPAAISASDVIAALILRCSL